MVGFVESAPIEEPVSPIAPFLSLLRQHDAHTFYNYNDKYDAAVHGGWGVGAGGRAGAVQRQRIVKPVVSVVLVILSHVFFSKHH